MAVSLFTGCEKEEPEPTPTPTPDPSEPVAPAPVFLLDAVTDIDGNHYDAVQIGNQVWMAQNLRTTHFADNTEAGGTSPDGDENNVEAYGRLYVWNAVMHDAPSSTANPSGVQGVCPDGWHVPSDAEWTQLTDYIISCGYYACGNDPTAIAKALADTIGWKISYAENAVGNNLAANNTTGFSVRPAGVRLRGQEPSSFGSQARFWSSTEIGNYAIYRGFYYHSGLVGAGSSTKMDACSVRCVKD